MRRHALGLRMCKTDKLNTSARKVSLLPLIELNFMLIFQIPFRLTLRVWDVYLLEGERILTAMAYNLLKLNRRTLMKLGMDDILQFLQVCCKVVAYLKKTE